MENLNLIKSTPIIPYIIKGKEIFVKREDLCIEQTNFSKMRGVVTNLKKVSNKVIGVLDSLHSKAGWGVSYVGKNLNKQVVLFYPKYKGEIQPRYNQIQALKFGAEIVPLQAGRSCILYHQAKKILQYKYKDSYMLPNALKLQESVDETAIELINTTPESLLDNTVWIVSVSSGTIGAGVLKGLLKLNAKVNVIVHLGYSRSISQLKGYMEKKSGDLSKLKIFFIDEKYSYKDSVKGNVPFPCNPYYDLKAWNWLINNLDKLKGKKIMFWNIGA